MSKDEKKRIEAELAAQARLWDKGEVAKTGWRRAPEAVPLETGSVAISLRLPAQALQIIRELARRKGVGYQILLKQWIDERLREEFQAHMDAQRTIVFGSTRIVRQAAARTFQSSADVALAPPSAR
jgi:predicted DNA binding CopG/RHH family protein